MRIRPIDAVALAGIISVFILLFTTCSVIMYYTLYRTGLIGSRVAVMFIAGILSAFAVTMFFLLNNYSIWLWVHSDDKYN